VAGAINPETVDADDATPGPVDDMGGREVGGWWSDRR
jgi:hypothetical protein